MPPLDRTTISLSSVGDMRCGSPDELEHAEHRVVDEQQPERVEAAVLERVDQQADARQPREQPDRARLREVPRFVVDSSPRRPVRAIVARCMTRRSW